MSSDQDNDLLLALLAEEDAAWSALSDGSGALFYEARLTHDALMVFPFGVLTRAEAIAAIASAPPWESYRIDEPQAVRLTVDAALLAYRATAQRAGQQPYRARMSTGFVRQDGIWKTAFHQQSPEEG